ncbi:MAG: B-box zinc finger protein [Anaerolineae bacterium]
MTDADMSRPLTCANHPKRETVLRCNRCEKPICTECAVLTEVGYRCRECVREQQAAYYNGQAYDLPLVGGVSLLLGAATGALAYSFLDLLGFFSFIVAILVGPAAGSAVVEAVRQAVRRRRSPHMKLVTAVAFVVGVLVAGLLIAALAGAVSGVVVVRVLFRLDVFLLAGLAASTIYTRIL